MEYCELDCVKINPTENICNVCGKDWKHYRMYKPSGSKGIKEFDLITAHSVCRSLLNKINNTKNKLKELEYELYIKKNNLE
jgi:hypothetical protein